MREERIFFTKMHGLGNDFVIIDNTKKIINISSLPIKLIANRYFGIGCDQVIIIEAAQATSKAHFFCRIFNSDGSEAEQCGNGLRCLGRFILDYGLANTPLLQLETKAGIFPVAVQDNNHISILMGMPKIEIPQLMLPLSTGQSIGPATIVSLGNPHAILSAEKIEEKLPTEWTELAMNHDLFPTGINLGFMQIVDRRHIKLRTIERGSGETYACGSNACAAVAAGIFHQQLDISVKVEFQYGSLVIEWPNLEAPIKMTGPATTVFTGEFYL